MKTHSFLVKRFMHQCFIIFTIINLGLLTSCFQNFYSINRLSSLSPEVIKELKMKNKYFILHSGDSVYEFSDLWVYEDTVSGYTATLPDSRHNFEKLNSKKTASYIRNGPNNQLYILDEVHLFADLPVIIGSKLKIPLNDIYNVEIYTHNKAATTGSALLGVLGLATGIAATAGLISTIPSSGSSYTPSSTNYSNAESCPFIYIKTDSAYKLIGEIYSGAIYPSLERNDYLPLPVPAGDSGFIELKMTNELLEVQHTNMIKLLVIDHPDGINVLMDKYGNLQTLGRLQPPVQALTLAGKNISEVLREQDNLIYPGEIFQKDQPLKSGAILSFSLTRNTRHAKLVIHAKNSPWLDYVVSNFHGLFGSEYNCWLDKQEKVSSGKMEKWVLNQGIPLSVFLEKNGKWKFVDYFNIIGPVAFKQDVLPLDLSEIQSDSVRIKLESGNRFWEIDYAGIDFSENILLQPKVALFDLASEKNGSSVREFLERADERYYVQAEIGDEVKMKFTLPAKENSLRSLILQSQGYYISKVNQEGKEQLKALLGFRKKDHMPAFSNDLLTRQIHLN